MNPPTPHRTGVLQGVLAILVFTLCLVLFLAGAHLAAPCFLALALYWLFPEQGKKVVGVVAVVVIMLCVIGFWIIGPWYISHKLWVWCFGG